MIIDYGDKAIMAHAVPSFKGQSAYPRAYTKEHNKETKLIDSGSVVEVLSGELKERGIAPSDCEAIVNAGTSESLYRIKKDLSQNGIRIREASLDGGGRNLIYNPVTNRLSVEYTKQ